MFSQIQAFISPSHYPECHARLEQTVLGVKSELHGCVWNEILADCFSNTLDPYFKIVYYSIHFINLLQSKVPYINKMQYYL